MTLIEVHAKQGTVPCLTCRGKSVCTARTRDKCGLYRAWEDYRREAYREHLWWCVRVCGWKGCTSQAVEVEK